MTPHDFVDPKNSGEVLEETVHIATLLSLGETERAIASVHDDIVRLFSGRYPGYRGSTTQYHDLEHTCSVVLATGRLLHGCALDFVVRPTPPDFLRCIMAAYFHDTGLIQVAEDTEGTGAKHTVGHEQRSIVFMEGYLTARGYGRDDVRACAEMIECTILDLSPDAIGFSSPNAGLLGRIVGTADLVAQLADRAYPAKLGRLSLEFAEAGLSGLSSEFDLVIKTEEFYSDVARNRLDGGLGGLHTHMRSHFRARWGLDEDLYHSSISANIQYVSDLAEAYRKRQL